MVPHYQLTSKVEGKGIQQQFRVGTTLFLLIDSRTFKNTRLEETD
jgi:hypothetical protein